MVERQAKKSQCSAKKFYRRVCPMSSKYCGTVLIKQGTNDENKRKKDANFMGQCPTEPRQSWTFGNFTCQMGQKHSLDRTLKMK